MIGPVLTPPMKPPKPPALDSRRVTGLPGLSYAASCRRSQSLRGCAPDSRIHVRTCRDVRSYSLSSPMPFPVKERPAYRHSVLAISVGALLNGDDRVINLSRHGT